MKCGGTSVARGLATGARRAPPWTRRSSSSTGRRPRPRRRHRRRQLDVPRCAAAVRAAHAAARRSCSGISAIATATRSSSTSPHFVTVLRDPVERIVSLYKYRRYKRGRRRPGVARLRRVHRDEALGEVGPPVRRYVLWTTTSSIPVPTRRSTPPSPISDASPRLASSIVSTTSRAGSRVPPQAGDHPDVNRSPAPDDADIDPASLERARELCAPDYRVYNQLVAAGVTHVAIGRVNRR